MTFWKSAVLRRLVVLDVWIEGSRRIVVVLLHAKVSFQTQRDIFEQGPILKQSCAKATVCNQKLEKNLI